MRTFFPAAAMLIFAAPPVAGQTDATVAARRLIERYYAAIDRGDFRTAYSAWGDGGRASGKSYAAFRQGFAETASSRVVAGRPGPTEGAAGSLYVEVPVDVYARLKNGRRQHFRGRYTLRRVNIAEAPTASRRWHIDSARLNLLR